MGVFAVKFSVNSRIFSKVEMVVNKEACFLFILAWERRDTDEPFLNFPGRHASREVQLTAFGYFFFSFSSFFSFPDFLSFFCFFWFPIFPVANFPFSLVSC